MKKKETNNIEIEKLYELAREAHKNKDPMTCMHYYKKIFDIYPLDWEACFYILLSDCLFNLDNREKRRNLALSLVKVTDLLLKTNLSEKEKIENLIQIHDDVAFYQLVLISYGIKVAEKNLNIAPADEAWEDDVYIDYIWLPCLFNCGLNKETKVNDKQSINSCIIYSCENLLKHYEYSQKYVDYHKIKNMILEIEPNYDFSEIESNKINSSNPPTSTGGCYVATCVYGSYDCPQVWVLRRYRDYKLDKSLFGRIFIKLYYAISPTVVKWFGNTKWFKKLWKNRLDIIVNSLKEKGYEDIPYNDKY